MGKTKRKQNFVYKKIPQGTFKFCQLVQEDQCAVQGVMLDALTYCLFLLFLAIQTLLRQIMRFLLLLKLFFKLTVMSNRDGVVGATLIAGVTPKFKPQAGDSDTEFDVSTNFCIYPQNSGILA